MTKWTAVHILSWIPNPAIIAIIQFIGNSSTDDDHFSPSFDTLTTLFTVCKSWYNRFDPADNFLWTALSVECKLDITFTSATPKSLRSKTNQRKLFLRSYAKQQIMLKDRHDQLIVAAKSLMENPGRDCPQKLSKLILKYFPDCRGFNVNWRCSTIENNSLITLAARHGHLKCMALLVEKFNSSIELGDVGGFTPLIASAYRGSFNCVMYCIEKGASACARG
eukprot:gene33163-44393_t